MSIDFEGILLDVSQSSAIDDGDLTVAANLMLRAVCRGLSIGRAGIWLFDDANEAIRSQYLIDLFDLDALANEVVISRRDFPRYFDALLSERTIPADDAQANPSTSEFTDVYLRPLNISSMLDVPIRHRGKMIGIICCEHQGVKRQWTSEEKVFAASMADLYGRAMSAKQRSDYENELKTLNEQLELKVLQRTQALENTLNDLKSTQSMLVESEKMAALGNLVAGVAHEVNTPLGIAITSVSYCQDELTQLKQAFENDLLDEAVFGRFLSDVNQALTMSSYQLKRAAELVHNFKRTAADQSNSEVEVFDVSLYLSNTLTSFAPVLRKQGIVVSLNLAPELIIKAVPGAVSQVLTNLISNTIRHAFPKDFVGDKQISISLSRETDGIHWVFKDNGVGMSELVLRKAFEPFFTTARHEGGTGLGMSILYNLVTQQLGGDVRVESQLNQGVTVLIHFPA